MVGATVEILQDCLHSTVYMISAQSELGWSRAHLLNILLDICVNVEVLNQHPAPPAECELISVVSDCDEQCSVGTT